MFVEWNWPDISQPLTRWIEFQQHSTERKAPHYRLSAILTKENLHWRFPVLNADNGMTDVKLYLLSI